MGPLRTGRREAPGRGGSNGVSKRPPSVPAARAGPANRRPGGPGRGAGGSVRSRPRGAMGGRAAGAGGLGRGGAGRGRGGGVGRGPSKATTSGRPARYGVSGSKRKAEVDDDDGSADDGDDDWDSAESLSGEDDSGAGFTFDEDDGDEAVGEDDSVVGDDEDFEGSSDGGSDVGEKSGDSDGDSDGDDHDDIDGSDSKPAKKERTEEEKRKVRQEQKKLLQERRASKPNASIVVRAKQIWEKLRMKSTPANERSQLMAEMMEVLTGKVHEVTFKHDMARTIQCALKYGNLKQREAIAGELKGSYVALASSQYGRFIASRILNYCPNHRPLVIDELKGHLRRLLFHAHAGPVIEEAWSRFANGAQRASLLEEFYGPQFALFRLGGTSSKAASLASMLAAEPEKRAATLDALRATLESLLSKPSTPLASSSLLHRVLLDYLSQAAPAHATGLVSGHLRDKLPLLLHTRDGARAAQMALLLSGPKDRRHALRSFRGLVGRIACEPFGHAVLLTACEAVDDTVAVAKYVFTELIKGPPPPTEAAGAAGASEDGPSDLLAALADNSGADSRPTLTPAQLLRDPHASRVVLFLLAGRNTRYQVGHVLAELQTDDVLRAQTSKKDDDVRRKELRTAVAPQLLELATANVEELIRTQWGGRVLCELMKCPEAGDKQHLIEAVAELTKGTEESHRLTHPKPIVKIVTKVPEAKDGSKAKKAFNAGRKLAQDAAEEKRKKEEAAAAAAAAGSGAADHDASQPVDTSEHVLVHRAATFCLKEMMAGRPARRPRPADAGGAPAASDGDGNDGDARDRARLAAAVLDAVGDELGHWVSACAADPRHTSGTAFVLLAALESAGDVAARKRALARLGGANELRKLLPNAERNAAAGAEAAAKTEEAADTGRKQKKRRVTTAATAAATGEAGVRSGGTGAEVLLRALVRMAEE